MCPITRIFAGECVVCVGLIEKLNARVAPYNRFARATRHGQDRTLPCCRFPTVEVDALDDPPCTTTSRHGQGRTLPCCRFLAVGVGVLDDPQVFTQLLHPLYRSKTNGIFAANHLIFGGCAYSPLALAMQSDGYSTQNQFCPLACPSSTRSAVYAPAGRVKSWYSVVSKYISVK